MALTLLSAQPSRAANVAIERAREAFASLRFDDARLALDEAAITCWLGCAQLPAGSLLSHGVHWAGVHPGASSASTLRVPASAGKRRQPHQ